VKLVILDTSVIIFQLMAKIQQLWGDSFPCDAAIYTQNAIKYLNENGWLPGLHGEECKVIWVEDRKPYWRSQFSGDYKATRSIKPEVFADIYGVFADSDVAKIAIQGYEADDIASAIVRLWMQSDRKNIDQLFLATVDSDWMGLVADQNVFWCGTREYPPRLRQRAEIYAWLRGKWNKQSKKKQKLWALPDELVFRSSDIWRWKIATGDASDNVRADSAEYMIDLLSPPRIYDLVNTHADEIKRAIAGAKLVSRNGWKDAQSVIFALGMLPPVDVLYLPQNLIISRSKAA
jgi:5'-3' exonuclease